MKILLVLGGFWRTMGGDSPHQGVSVYVENSELGQCCEHALHLEQSPDDHNQ